MGDGLASVLSGTYKAVQFIFKLTTTHEDTQIVHEQLRGLSSNATQLRALLNDPKVHIEQAQKERISNLLYDTFKLIDRIAVVVEKSRVDEIVYGTTTLINRITWELRDKDTVAKYQPLIVQYLGDLSREITSVELRGHRHFEDEPKPGRVLRQSTLGKRSISETQEEVPIDSQSLDTDHASSQKDWVRWLNNDDLVVSKQRKRKKTKKVEQTDTKNVSKAHDAQRNKSSGLSWMIRDLEQFSDWDKKRRRSGEKSGSSNAVNKPSSDDD